MTWQRIELGEWLPDKADVNLAGLAIVENLVPTAEGYDVIEGLRVLPLSALNGTVFGALRGRMNEKEFIAAGTATSLYYQTDGDWIETPGYSLPVENKWVFRSFTTQTPVDLADFILATCGGEVIPPQVVDIRTGTPSFGNLSDDASFGAVCGILRNFFFLGDIQGRNVNVAIGREEGGLHWSGIGDPKSWPQVGTQAATDAQSDINVFPGDGGKVTGIIQAGEFGIIFRERQVWRADFVGPPAVWEFRLIDDKHGMVTPDAAIAIGGIVYFPSAVGFMACNGSSVLPIGLEKVDRDWRKRVSRMDFYRASVVHDQRRRMIWWSFVTNGAALPNRIYGYHYALNRWSQIVEDVEFLTTYSDVDETGNMDLPPLATQDMDVPASSGGLGDVNMDTLTGGGVLDEAFAAFRADHKLYTFSSEQELTGRIVTGNYSDPSQRRLVLNKVRPIFSIGSDDTAINLRMATGILPQELVDVPKQNGLNSLGIIPYRTKGRYLRAEFTTAGRIRQFQAFEADLAFEGTR